MAQSPTHSDVFTDPLTPVVLLERTLRVFPKRSAMIHGGLHWTYDELGREVGRMAGALRRAGV